MIEVQRCCAVTREDLRSAHERVGELERRLTVLAAQVADLTQRLATAVLERDTLRRDQTATTISNIQTEGKAA